MQNVALNVYRALSLLAPFDIDIEKRLVGGRNDGAYVLANILDERDIISIGIDHNDKFDFALAEEGHRIFMFDHTISRPPRSHENFFFYEIGVCGSISYAGNMKPLGEIVSLVSSGAKLILKIDVEGAELDVFASAPPHVLARFEQIVVEVHWLERLGEEAFCQNFCDAFQNINEYFTLFHVHANNYCNINIVEGFAVASVLELSYIRTDLVNRKHSSTIYPSELCYPNNALNHDLPLLFFPFLPTCASSQDLDKVVVRIDRELKTSLNVEGKQPGV